MPILFGLDFVESALEQNHTDDFRQDGADHFHRWLVGCWCEPQFLPPEVTREELHVAQYHGMMRVGREEGLKEAVVGTVGPDRGEFGRMAQHLPQVDSNAYIDIKVQTSRLVKCRSPAQIGFVHALLFPR